MSVIDLFIVHGRDHNARNDLVQWIEEANRKDLLPAEIDINIFEEKARPGQLIPSELERLSQKADAAIALATADDVGGLEGEGADEARARENVWIEYGMLWSLLGRERTCLLKKGGVNTPSDIQGELYIRFEESIEEIQTEILEFLRSLPETRPGPVTEVVRASRDTGTRTKGYQTVRDSAKDRIVITGIGKTSVRYELTKLFSNMKEKRTRLRLDFLIMDKEHYKQINERTESSEVSEAGEEGVLDEFYRPGVYEKIDSFEKRLGRKISGYSDDVCSRVNLFRYPGLKPFSATIADPGQMGSLMLVETVQPEISDSGAQARPRVMLKRRCRDRLYDRYWETIEAMLSKSSRVDPREILQEPSSDAST